MAAGGGLVGLATAGGPRLWQNPYRRGVGTDAGSEWTGAPDCTGRADGGGCARCDGRGRVGIDPDAQRPRFEPSKRRLTWPNGAMATTYSADEPERLRGPQHDSAWCDE